jgi:hypothetical protein
MGAPVLIGAGVGALGSALTGNNPFKGALIGGGLGAGGAGIQSLLKGGSFMSGAFPSLSNAAGGAGVNLLPAAAAKDGAISFVPTAANVPVAGINLAPMTSSTPVGLFEYGTGAGAGITDLANYATGAGTELMQPLSYYDQLKSMLPELSSENVGNVIGGARVAQQYMQQPRLQAPAGGISRGNPPESDAVQKLIAQMKPQERKRISLLVG